MKLQVKGERDKQLSYAFIGLSSLVFLLGAGNVLTGSLAWYFATTQKTITTPMSYIRNLRPVTVPVISEVQTTIADSEPDNHRVVTTPVISSGESNVISLLHGRNSSAGTAPEAPVTDESAPSMSSEPVVFRSRRWRYLCMTTTAKARAWRWYLWYPARRAG